MKIMQCEFVDMTTLSFKCTRPNKMAAAIWKVKRQTFSKTKSTIKNNFIQGRFEAGFLRIFAPRSRPCSVLVLSTEFRTDRPIRTKMAGECENSSILRWQVRLILIRARNGLVTALSTVIWTIFGPQILSYYIKYFWRDNLCNKISLALVFCGQYLLFYRLNIHWGRIYWVKMVKMLLT